MKYTTNFRGDTIKDPMRNLSLEDIDKNYWINKCREYEDRLQKIKEFIWDGKTIIAIDMDGGLYSSKDFLEDIVEGREKL